MKWSDLPFRSQDPCDQVVEHFDDVVSQADLTSALNALSRQGFTDLEYDPLLEDVDEAYQEQRYRVTAARMVCACKRKLDYLKVE